ncbi:MAG: hypothetical protein PVJ98_10690 [Akkermansiaceae bacterium]|jgi:hypothetical protein
MGRREIWSDPQIQKVASEFVCVIEETFFLYPPDWMKDPPNPAATRLFQKYVENSPKGLFPAKTSTYQGLYCMTANGGFLSGKFARQNRRQAMDTLQGALGKWRPEVERKGISPQKVPTNRLAMYGGEEIRPGGLKLEVVYRDFPRGEVRRPGNAQFPNPYNMGWFDFSPSEAASFVTGKKEKVAIPDRVFRKLATSRFKDAVRGQMQDWKKGDLKKGALFVRLLSSKGSTHVYALEGEAFLQSGDLSFAPMLTGEFSFNTRTREFTSFKMIAAGQRTGKGAANGRATDLGPAPMGISFKLYQP